MEKITSEREYPLIFNDLIFFVQSVYMTAGVVILVCEKAPRGTRRKEKSERQASGVWSVGEKTRKLLS